MTSFTSKVDQGTKTCDVPTVDVDKESRKVYEENSIVFQNNIFPADVADYYTSWAADYEKGFHTTGLYPGPSCVADTLASVFKTNRGSVRVLDVAAGTGILGEQLNRVGFRNIDGLDPSPGMLDICRRKNIYSDLVCNFMTENPSDISTDTYDCLGISGGMGPGHIPRGALREMIRIVKPGGYICISLRQEFVEMAEEYRDNKLEEAMSQLERHGLWKEVERRLLPVYFYNKPGLLFLHKVL